MLTDKHRRLDELQDVPPGFDGCSQLAIVAESDLTEHLRETARLSQGMCRSGDHAGRLQILNGRVLQHLLRSRHIAGREIDLVPRAINPLAMGARLTQCPSPPPNSHAKSTFDMIGEVRISMRHHVEQ
jgi:hypothetical protein